MTFKTKQNRFLGTGSFLFYLFLFLFYLVAQGNLSWNRSSYLFRYITTFDAKRKRLLLN